MGNSGQEEAEEVEAGVEDLVAHQIEQDGNGFLDEGVGAFELGAIVFQVESDDAAEEEAEGFGVDGGDGAAGGDFALLAAEDQEGVGELLVTILESGPLGDGFQGTCVAEPQEEEAAVIEGGGGECVEKGQHAVACAEGGPCGATFDRDNDVIHHAAPPVGFDGIEGGVFGEEIALGDAEGLAEFEDGDGGATFGLQLVEVG